MARYGVFTNLDPEEVIRRAVDFFGPDGLGLEMTDQGERHAIFEGGGGQVAVSVLTGKQTEVEIVTREYDYDVNRFIGEIT
jgi:hypothetical protein